MKLSFSKRFIKQAKTLDSITKKLLHTVLEEAEEANRVEEIGNCMKMSGYKQVYRIRISDHRAIFRPPDGFVLILSIHRIPWGGLRKEI